MDEVTRMRSQVHAENIPTAPPVTFPVTNEPARAGAGWRRRKALRGIYDGGRWSVSGSGGSGAAEGATDSAK
jgi:hypothetical protein